MLYSWPATSTLESWQMLSYIEMDRLERCEEKVDYLIKTIIPLLEERNDLLQRTEVLLISLNALYQKRLPDG